MKRFLILIPLCILGAETNEVTDLGFLTKSKPIMLVGCQRRTDFSHFMVKVAPHGWQTNTVTVTNITGTLTENDLRWVPQGPAQMEVVQVCQDGEVSEPATFTFNLQRTRPSKPRAVSPLPGPMPPTPPGLTQVTNALPNAVQEASYADFRRRTQKGIRRNQ